MAAPQNRPKMSWQSELIALGSKILDSAYAGIFVVGLLICSLAFVLTRGLSSGDRLTFLISLLGQPILQISGWLVAIVIFAVARFLLKQQAKLYKDQIAHHERIKEESLRQQELPLTLEVTAPSDKLKK